MQTSTTGLLMPEDVQVDIEVDGQPQAVWASLTSAVKLKEFFFGSDVVTDWKVGSPILFRGEWRGKAYEDKGEIVAFDPPHRLAYTHWSPMSGTADRPENYHLVAFELAPDGPKTRVTLTQSSAEGAAPPSAAARAEFAKNWSAVLHGLKKTVERR